MNGSTFYLMENEKGEVRGVSFLECANAIRELVNEGCENIEYGQNYFRMEKNGRRVIFSATSKYKEENERLLDFVYRAYWLLHDYAKANGKLEEHQICLALNSLNRRRGNFFTLWEDLERLGMVCESRAVS